MSTRRLRRRLGVLIAATGLLALVLIDLAAGPAAAHNTLRSTDPADRSTVATTPAAIVLTFDEPAIALGTQLAVDGPAGPVQTGPARLVDNTVTQTLRPGSPAGAYTVTWRVTSADGHPISGTFTFTASAANPDAPAPAASPPSPGPAAPQAPGFRWEWLVLAAGLLAVGLFVLREVRRGRRSG